MTRSFAKVDYELIQLKGGMDEITPTLSLATGAVRSALNFSCSPLGGYERIAGYERYDGRPSPSNATYQVLWFDFFVGTSSVGAQVSNQVEQSATIIAIGANYIVISKSSGAFGVGDVVQDMFGTIGTVSLPSGQISSKLSAQFQASAADLYRADILAPSGDGACLGVTLYKDTVYAFRATAGFVNLYKASSTGWVQVPFLYEIRFNLGTTLPTEGSVLTQGGVTAVIRRVITQTGAWTGTAAGRLIIELPIGGNFAAGAATTTSSTMTLIAAESAITMAGGGKFEFRTANFYGNTSTIRLYGADGVNRAFEFDGAVLVPIETGANADTPKHILAHKNRLFVTQGSSLMYSVVGDPNNWQASLFAGEMAVGDNITGIETLPGAQTTSTMIVTTRSNTYMLYGTTNDNFNLVSFNTGAGALDYSIQNMAQTHLFDDKGVISLQTTLNFGNFDQAALTFNISKFIAQKRNRVSYSVLDRQRSQYRVFFNDGYGLYLTILNGQWIGTMPVFYPAPVYMAYEDKFSTGEEASFFASSDGFVYQMDKGTSFDGLPIDAYITLNFDSIKSPRILKRFRKCAVDITGGGYCDVKFGYKLGYDSSRISQDMTVSYERNMQVPKWDGFVWDNFTWDGRLIEPTECEMSGTAENVALTFSSSTAYIQSYIINTAIIHYTPRRGIR